MATIYVPEDEEIVQEKIEKYERAKNQEAFSRGFLDGAKEGACIAMAGAAVALAVLKIIKSFKG